MSADTTPVLRDVVARRDDSCEHERTRLLDAVRPLDVRLAIIDEELQALDRLLAVRRDELARVVEPLDASSLVERRAGEAGLAPELVRHRRETEWRRAREAAEQAVAAVQHRIDALLAERASVQAACRNRVDVARSRVLRLAEHADRKAAIYRRALVRRHPQREALVRQWTPLLPAPPGWAAIDPLPEHETTGAHA